MIYQNDQQLKGYLVMLFSHHDNNFSFGIILEMVKRIKFELPFNSPFIHRCSENYKQDTKIIRIIIPIYSCHVHAYLNHIFVL